MDEGDCQDRIDSRLDEILDEVLDLAESDVPAHLDRRCAGAPELRARIEAILDADREVTAEFLRPAVAAEAVQSAFTGDVPEGGPLSASDSAEELPAGASVGAWKIVREVGRGGMARVYLAERREESYEQRAAIKVIRRGVDRDEVQSRFLRERRILARLQHPGIAGLIDGGVMSDGTPWFAMEFVDGKQITEWSQARRLDVEGKVRVFLRVCEAVRYAHQNLVVHRDIKPSNIFVTANGDAKLLDFGIARLLEQDEEGTQTLTVAGGRPMTPRYAAPEQLIGQAVTTATDIYGLGVVLYELLAGVSPFRAPGSSISEYQRLVLETEPARPSDLVDSVNESIDRDLDNIVLTAIAKRPEDRYASVEALASDLERWLHGLPVRATASTFRYRSSKFIRRNRPLVFASAAATLAFLVGLAATRWQLPAAGIVIASLVGGLSYSSVQARKARAAAKRAEEIKHFLLRTFEVADPMRAQGKPITVRELVDRGASQVETELADQPELRAEMLGVLGEIYVQLSLPESGLPLVEREIAVLKSLVKTPPARQGDALRRRGNLLIQAGRWSEAEADLRRASELHRRDLGPSSPEYAEDLDQLAGSVRVQSRASEAEALVRESLEIRRTVLGGWHPKVATSYNNLALMMRDAGRPIEAEALYRRAFEIRAGSLSAEDPTHFLTAINLSITLRQLGRIEEALALLDEMLSRFGPTFGEGHDLVVTARNTRAALYLDLERFAEAEAEFADILHFWEQRAGRSHPNAIMTVANLAFAQRGLGRVEESIATAREAIDLWRAQYGGAHVAMSNLLANLAKSLELDSRIDEAVTALDDALSISTKVRGAGHFDTATLKLSRAALARKMGRPADERRFLSEAIEVLNEVLPPSHRRLKEAMERAAELGLPLRCRGRTSAVVRSTRD
ncbi:MAG: serine/threonine-protein kinase [Candidatus Eisenbacteria bacterium]